jgi:hypothetical protein
MRCVPEPLMNRLRTMLMQGIPEEDVRRLFVEMVSNCSRWAPTPPPGTVGTAGTTPPESSPEAMLLQPQKVT